MAPTTSSKNRVKRTSSSRSTKVGSGRVTSASSTSGSKRRIDRPFDPAVIAKARKIAAQYRIILEPDEDPAYVGHPLELPGCFGGGDTPDAAVENIREAAASLVAYLLEKGQTPPAPASEAKRTEQINVRLTDEEKLRIESAARREGFRGISDYVRTKALAG